MRGMVIRGRSQHSAPSTAMAMASRSEAGTLASSLMMSGMRLAPETSQREGRGFIERMRRQ
jgi:hypothetical protein